jgi:hypothetical protein
MLYPCEASTTRAVAFGVSWSGTTMNGNRWVIVSVVLLFASYLTSTVHAEVACPQNVAVEQKASPPNPWSLEYSKSPAELSSVMIFDGPPEEQASLKYDDERTTEDEIIQTWQLPASDRGYWIVCGYSNTTAQLRRKLPSDILACEVVFEKGVSFGGGGLDVKHAVCKASNSRKPTH